MVILKAKIKVTPLIIVALALSRSIKPGITGFKLSNCGNSDIQIITPKLKADPNGKQRR